MARASDYRKFDQSVLLESLLDALIEGKYKVAEFIINSGADINGVVDGKPFLSELYNNRVKISDSVLNDLQTFVKEKGAKKDGLSPDEIAYFRL